MSISGRFGRIFWLVQHKHTQWVQGKPPTKYEFYKSMQSLPVNEWPSIDLFAARMAEAERQYRSTAYSAQRVPSVAEYTVPG